MPREQWVCYVILSFILLCLLKIVVWFLFWETIENVINVLNQFGFGIGCTMQEGHVGMETCIQQGTGLGQRL